MNVNEGAGARAIEAYPLQVALLVDECRRCRRDLPAHWQLCADCDARLATVCPACGVSLPPAGTAHCGHCGIELGRLIPGWGEALL